MVDELLSRKQKAEEDHQRMFERCCYAPKGIAVPESSEVTKSWKAHIGLAHFHPVEYYYSQLRHGIYVPDAQLP